MNLIEQLKIHEGVKLKPYLCTAGKLTIGVGRNLDDVGITLEEAETMLINDIANVTEQLKRRVYCFETLSTPRQEVLINMAFNIGVSGLLKFKLMIKCLERREYAKASVEMLDSLWARQVGYRANELSTQMITGHAK